MSAGDPAEEVRRLANLGLEGLRGEWSRRFGTPPALRSADLLRRNLAWRIQADRFGGLPDETRKLLLQKRSILGAPRLIPGVRLMREWRGVRHEVEITEAGVRYAGDTFDNLSQVARQITGTRWNGPRFFGLRETGGQP